MNATENAPKITATNSDREIMEAIWSFEIKSLFNELYPATDDDQDLPF